MTQLLSIHSWKWIVPCVVSAVKSGAVSFMRNDMAIFYCTAATLESVAMKQDASFFEGKDPVLIYIAKRLRDALRLEGILSSAGVDYGVEADEYKGGIIFHSVRTGAFF